MGKLVNYVTALHKATNRIYIDRMVDDKVNCMLKAKEYEADYWDGDRRYGYGGYKYIPGRWKPVAKSALWHPAATRSWGTRATRGLTGLFGGTGTDPKCWPE